VQSKHYASAGAVLGLAEPVEELIVDLRDGANGDFGVHMPPVWTSSCSVAGLLRLHT
jgi:hypothetical protein